MTQDLQKRVEDARSRASCLRLMYDIIPRIRIIKKFRALRAYAHANVAYKKLEEEYKEARTREGFAGRNWGVSE